MKTSILVVVGLIDSLRLTRSAVSSVHCFQWALPQVADRAAREIKSGNVVAAHLRNFFAYASGAQADLHPPSVTVDANELRTESVRMRKRMSVYYNKQPGSKGARQASRRVLSTDITDQRSTTDDFARMLEHDAREPRRSVHASATCTAVPIASGQLTPPSTEEGEHSQPWVPFTVIDMHVVGPGTSYRPSHVTLTSELVPAAELSALATHHCLATLQPEAPLGASQNDIMSQHEQRATEQDPS
jgi:hypothetical protein